MDFELFEYCIREMDSVFISFYSQDDEGDETPTAISSKTDQSPPSRKFEKRRVSKQNLTPEIFDSLF